jgi:prepilin-type N-terminal cleavage/methylation domain-containing protein
MKKGFTIIELLISISIIGILASLGYKSYTSAITSANVSKSVNEIKKIEKAISSAYGKTGQFFESQTSTVTDIESNTFLLDELNQLGLRQSSGMFRLSSVPSSKIYIPLGQQGYRLIAITGIPGSIAKGIVEELNEGKKLVTSGGSISIATPIVVAKGNVDISSLATDSDEASTDIVEILKFTTGLADTDIISDINIIEKLPRTTVFYFYQVGSSNASW